MCECVKLLPEFELAIKCGLVIRVPSAFLNSSSCNVQQDNEKSLKLTTHLGFVDEAILEAAGDGGVDISPIADLYKSEVRELATELNISDSILSAQPTDGLWSDGRTDEDQIGATYDELEAVMKKHWEKGSMTERQTKVTEIYKRLHMQNQHKMNPIPVCKMYEER